MAKCISDLGAYYVWLASTPPSWYVANVTYSIDTGDGYNNLQVPFNYSDSLSTIIQTVHNAVKADALSRFGIVLADSDIRVL